MGLLEETSMVLGLPLNEAYIIHGLILSMLFCDFKAGEGRSIHIAPNKIKEDCRFKRFEPTFEGVSVEDILLVFAFDEWIILAFVLLWSYLNVFVFSSFLLSFSSSFVNFLSPPFFLFSPTNLRFLIYSFDVKRRLWFFSWCIGFWVFPRRFRNKF